VSCATSGGRGAARPAGHKDDAPSMRRSYVLVLLVQAVTLAALWFFQGIFGN
jgi:hypothetical protein